MKISAFLRYGAAILIVLVLFIQSWLVSPAPVFSQEEVPVFSADECPETKGGYVEAESGHHGFTGFLNCNYYKEDADNKELSNLKHLTINYYSSSDEALETLKESNLSDTNLSKFSCESYECDNFERALLDRTEDSYLGYFIGKYLDPYHYSLEQCFVYDNFVVTILASGNLFSGIDEAISEMEELEVAAKQLADEPRETVTRETSGDDCGCDDPTEEPTEVSDAESIEDDTEDEGDDSKAQDLAALFLLYGTDPEKLREWPGWEGLTDTQRNTLLTLIDRLDDVLSAESPESVIKADAAEESTDPEKVILQSAEILKNELWVISTILNQYQYYNYFGDGPGITTETVGEIDQHLTNKIDPIIDMFIPITPADFEYTLVKFASLAGEGKNLTPEEIAQIALENLLGNDKNVLRVLDLYSIYREAYDRAQSGSDNLTAEEIHKAAITKITSSGYSLDTSTLMTLFSLRQKNVPAPNIPGIEERR